MARQYVQGNLVRYGMHRCHAQINAYHVSSLVVCHAVAALVGMAVGGVSLQPYMQQWRAALTVAAERQSYSLIRLSPIAD